MSEETHTFTASRLTGGNLFYPVRITITPQRVVRIKPHLIGAEEESMPINRVASVQIRTGLIWSEIRIDSTGGTNPILSRGHLKEDARLIRDLIEQFQQRESKTG